MSVVTLLSAVSGAIFLVSDHGTNSSTAAGAMLSDETLALAVIPAPRVDGIAYQGQVDAQTDANLALLKRAEAKARAQAKAKAKAAAARVKAAAERRAKVARQAASRSAQRDPQTLARIMAADRGWGAGQFSCLRSLWTKESGWNYRASNPSSGAYGIPQALPGGKMASAGSDWRTNPATQIAWGLDYIGDRYGTPCGAWGHSQSSGWY